VTAANQKQKTAITPTREQDYAEWYQQVIKAADLAENAPVRGCMIVKPWGWAIWELIRDTLDKRIKETGHQNAYFPLFVPISFLEKEAKHVEGFAKECAVVTHHRLENQEGKLVPVSPLEEPLIVRPTSETIVGDAFSRWVQSWRDLPLLINQWANVVRWEMRTRLFLRTAEFLWQEGHTVHATSEEAIIETEKMLGVYRELVEETLAIPAILGKKSESERFPGAVETYTIEMMMQDRKALQGGTSHYLGQNFSKAFNICFNNKEEKLEYGYTTSWGVTTRLVGALIMAHSDDDGLCLPPKVSPYHAVIIPVINKPEVQEEVLAYCTKLQQALCQKSYAGRNIAVHIDTRDMRGGDKNWEWVKKGVPLRIEIGPRDIANSSCMVARRDAMTKKPYAVSELTETIAALLDEMQNGYFTRAKTFQEEHTHTTVTTLDELQAFFTPKNPERPEIHGGFVKAKWSMDPESEKLLEELKITIRCLPLEQSNTQGRCILTGKPATVDAIFAKAY